MHIKTVGITNYVQKSEIIYLKKVKTDVYKRQQDWAAYLIQQASLSMRRSAYSLHEVGLVARVVGLPILHVVQGTDKVGRLYHHQCNLQDVHMPPP